MEAVFSNKYVADILVIFFDVNVNISLKWDVKDDMSVSVRLKWFTYYI